MQKDSIKRVQSQAGLSFAERKNRRSLAGGESNFRPQVKNKLLLLLVLLMTAATGAWGMQIYISYPSWPTGTNVNGDGNLVLEMEASDSFENMKAKIEDKSGLNPDYMKLYFNSVEMANNETLNAKGVTSNSVLTLVYTPPFSVTMKDGVKDADKWTVKVDDGQAQALPIGGLKGDGSETVTLKYTGRLKVKGVKATSDEKPAAPTGKTVDLSTLTAGYEAQDGETLTGTLAGNYKISIADGATVTLDGVTINGVNDGNYEWAGITCLGDATIILSGTNTVKGFYEDYPGIQAAADKTLIINGTGSLTASNYGYAAAIGGGNKVACGNIEIQGGTITATTGGRVAGIGGGHNASCGNITISGGTVTATGGTNGAGIGGGYNASWGNITISGGTVNATGGEYGAGIGGGKRGAASFSCGNIIISGGTVTATGGNNAPGIGGGRGNNIKTLSSCGDITIANTVTKVTATKGENAPNSIGAGYWGNCGTVTIGGTKYWENDAAVNGGDTYLAQATIVYDPAAQAGKTVDLSTLTADYEAKDGETLTGTLASNVKISIADGATVTLDGVNISNGQIACSGNANIILMGANTVTGASEKAAIKIGGSGTTLTITGSGSLTAQGGLEAAGIGTDRNENGELSFGNIVINGGTVTATGGKEGAGIGTGLAQGEFFNTSITCGDITINGGTVTAIGGLYGAGIGTGPTMSDGGSASITCGDITINGGTVTATGGGYGPGIGTGVFMKYGSESASNRCGNITIGAGVTSVTATKGSGSPNSIGKGYAYGGTQNYGTITIGGDATTYANGVTTSPFTYTPSN